MTEEGRRTETPQGSVQFQKGENDFLHINSLTWNTTLKCRVAFVNILYDCKESYIQLYFEKKFYQKKKKNCDYFNNLMIIYN